MNIFRAMVRNAARALDSKEQTTFDIIYSLVCKSFADNLVIFADNFYIFWDNLFIGPKLPENILEFQVLIFPSFCKSMQVHDA